MSISSQSKTVDYDFGFDFVSYAAYLVVTICTTYPYIGIMNRGLKTYKGILFAGQGACIPVSAQMIISGDRPFKGINAHQQ
jgi:hypothetical protein